MTSHSRYRPAPIKTNVARLLAPRVSPRRLHEFHEGEVFCWAGNIWNTRGPRGPTALRPLTAASTSALLQQSANVRQVRVGDKQTDEQTEGHYHRVKPTLLRRELNSGLKHSKPRPALTNVQCFKCWLLAVWTTFYIFCPSDLDFRLVW